jgi:hypothetical protein
MPSKKNISNEELSHSSSKRLREDVHLDEDYNDEVHEDEDKGE